MGRFHAESTVIDSSSRRPWITTSNLWDIVGRVRYMSNHVDRCKHPRLFFLNRRFLQCQDGFYVLFLDFDKSCCRWDFFRRLLFFTSHISGLSARRQERHGAGSPNRPVALRRERRPQMEEHVSGGGRLPRNFWNAPGHVWSAGAPGSSSIRSSSPRLVCSREIR